VLAQRQRQASPAGGQPEEKTVLSVWDLNLCQSPPSPNVLFHLLFKQKVLV